MKHLSIEQLEAGLDEIRQSPADEGVLELIVRRPATGEREIVEKAELDLVVGLVGDRWGARTSSRSGDSPDPDTQLNIMNARVLALVAQTKDRWPLAGDQLIIDLDLSEANIPAGTRLALGTALIEVTPEPHTGCRKFADRFGREAVKFVNSRVGAELRLRGINAKVVRSGTIRVGDRVTKVARASRMI